jgi:polyisoprenoid-binding protein YceI
MDPQRRKGETMKLLIPLVFLSAISIAAVSPNIDLKTAKDTVTFVAVGNPGFMKIKGEVKKEGAVSGNFSIVDNKMTGSAVVKLDSFDTGMELRNDHMKNKYLEVQKYPDAVLTLEPISLKEDSSYEGPFQGKLKLHGKEKDVKGTAKINKEADKWGGELIFDFALSDFGVDTPSWLGVSVTKDVTVTAKFKQ